MATTTVVVHGLPQLKAALKKMEREAAKYARDALEKEAGPIARTATQKKGRYQGAALGNIFPRTFARTGTVWVEDKTPPHTGLRGDFGSLLMREVMFPALKEHEEDVVRGLDAALDRLGRRAGF